MVRAISTNSCEDACVKITWCIRSIGLLPLNERFQLEPRRVAVSSLLVMFLLGNSAYWIRSENLRIDGLYHYILYCSRKILESAAVILIMIEFILKRDRLRSIVYNMKMVETALAQAGARWSWSIQPQQYLRLPLLTIILVGLPLVHEETYFWTIVHIEVWFIGIYVFHFCAFCDMLKYNLTQIRTTEECTLHTKLYTMIESSFQDLNAVNGIGVFLILFSYFLNTLHQIYKIFNIDNLQWDRIVDIMSSATYHASFILWIILACSGVSSEANMFNTTLYNKLAQNNDESLNYDDTILHFVMKKGLRFEASGFFSVTNSLICSMVITATTYLVILLQWSPRTPPRNE